MKDNPRSLTATELAHGVRRVMHARPEHPPLPAPPTRVRRSRLTPEQQADRAMTEDELLDYVLNIAHFAGWLAYHVRNSQAGIIQGDSGYPDLTLARAGRTIWVELKQELAVLSPGQEKWRTALAGQEYYVWRPSDWRTGAIREVLRFD